MRRLLLPLALLLVGAASASAQTVTGLSDWSLYLDPGHSQTENDGVFGYSEAEKVLRVGLALREMLLTRTDIDTVYLSRTTDAQQVGLSQRVDQANSVAADYFHSIHSNAAGPDVNYLFVLWAQLPSLEEPAPPYAGGRAMAEEMGPALADAMRIRAAGTNGGFGECAFYGAGSCRSVEVTPKGSRNFVQSFTLMPSTLSEAGFHTSPVQNQRNMNADWKRLEAQAMYWGILDYHGIPRSVHRIASGIVTDAESGRPIDGATVEIDGQTYTTDTFESLFNQLFRRPRRAAERVLLPRRRRARHAHGHGHGAGLPDGHGADHDGGHRDHVLRRRPRLDRPAHGRGVGPGAGRPELPRHRRPHGPVQPADGPERRRARRSRSCRRAGRRFRARSRSRTTATCSSSTL